MAETMKHLAIRLIVSITSIDKGKTVANLLDKAHVGMRFQFKAFGTASSEILDCLGLGETEKIVTIGLAPKEEAGRIFEVLKIELQLSRSGRGIAFTLPISGLSNPVFKMIDAHKRQEIHDHIEREVKKVKCESAYELILATINQGYSEELMDAARKAGARGGTVIHARRIGSEENMKFWGISVQEEREIVAILAKKEDKIAIMKAVNISCGISTEARGMIFSLPVDDVAGLEEAQLEC